MVITELIAELENIKENNGDLPVFIADMYEGEMDFDSISVEQPHAGGSREGLNKKIIDPRPLRVLLGSWI
jgi:hypothetical protein